MNIVEILLKILENPFLDKNYIFLKEILQEEAIQLLIDEYSNNNK